MERLEAEPIADVFVDDEVVEVCVSDAKRLIDAKRGLIKLMESHGMGPATVLTREIAELEEALRTGDTKTLVHTLHVEGMVDGIDYVDRFDRRPPTRIVRAIRPVISVRHERRVPRPRSRARRVARRARAPGRLSDDEPAEPPDSLEAATNGRRRRAARSVAASRLFWNAGADAR